MGQQSSKEEARLLVLSEERIKLIVLLGHLQPFGTAEAVRGIPATPGTHQAQEKAAVDHLNLLLDEDAAITARRAAQREGRSLPMPKRTPPLILPPLSQPNAQPAPASALPAGVQPGTPTGSAVSAWRQRGKSSSSKEAAPAGDVESSIETPLLAGHGH